jgi:predicted MFS family arabinose efflux permease
MTGGPAPATTAGAGMPTVRLQIASIFTAYGVAGLYWGAYVAALPAMQATSGLEASGFGLLLTATTLGGIAALQILGRVLHRVQAWAIPACLAGFAFGMTALGLATGPVSLGIALFAAGGASGALDIALNMRVARIEADTGQRLFNRVHALFPFSMLVTSAAVGLLREAGATPAQIFPPIALAFLAAAVLERWAGAHQRPAAGARGGGRPPLAGALVLLGLLAAMGAIMEGGAQVWSAIYVEGALGQGPAMAGFAAAAITLGLTCGRLVAHRLEHRVRGMAILRGFALAAVPAFLVLAFVPHPAAVLAGFFLAGVGIGPVEPAVFRAVARRHDEAARGRALALATGLAYLGYLASPPLLGRLIAAAGWTPMWLVLAAMGVLAAALTLRIPPAR